MTTIDRTLAGQQLSMSEDMDSASSTGQQKSGAVDFKTDTGLLITTYNAASQHAEQRDRLRSYAAAYPRNEPRRNHMDDTGYEDHRNH